MSNGNGVVRAAQLTEHLDGVLSGSVVLMETQNLKPAYYNPKQRMNQARRKKLRMDIAAHGIIIPILVLPDGRILDGHGRWSCARELGWQHVPCLVLSGETVGQFASETELFITLNNLGIKISPPQYAEIYQLTGGKAEIPADVLRRVRAIEQTVGKDGLAKLVRTSTSPTMWEWVVKISRYCHEETASFKSRVFHWLIDLDQQYPARKAMEDTVDADLLRKAVNQGRPIRQLMFEPTAI